MADKSQYLVQALQGLAGLPSIPTPTYGGAAPAGLMALAQLFYGGPHRTGDFIPQGRDPGAKQPTSYPSY